MTLSSFSVSWLTGGRRSVWLGVGLLVVFLCANFLWGLGGYDLSAPDEPRYALVAQEMIENGHWLFLHRNDQLYPDKPPLFFWLTAFFSLLNGGEVTAWTARLPSALAGISLVIMLGFWASDQGRRPRRGLLALVMASTTYLIVSQAHNAQIDMLLCALITASLLVAHQGVRAGDFSRAWLVGLLWGLGILAKGPVGYLVPAGGLALYLWFAEDRGPSDFPKRALAWGLLPPALWLLALVILSAAQHHWAYLENLVFKQTVVRYFDAWHHHRPFYYFAKTLLTDMLPWTFPFLAAIPWRKEARRALDDKQRFAWAICLFTIVFFSLSKGKRNLYILPLYPFAVYLAVRCIIAWREMPGARIALYASGGIQALVAVGLLVLAAGPAPLPVLDEAGLTLPRGLLFLAGSFSLLVVSLGLFWLKKQAMTRAVAALALCMFGLQLLIWQGLYPWVSPARSARAFCAEIQEIMGPPSHDQPLAMVHFRAAYRYYGDRPLVELERSSREQTMADVIEDYIAAHPRGYLISRRRDIEAYLPDWEQRLHLEHESFIGDQKQMLLLRPKP